MEIPVLDWQRFTTGEDVDGFVRDLGRACRETGFFLITGHGIPDDLIKDVFAKGDMFFARPMVEKSKVDIRNNPHNRGWACEGSESLDETSGQMDRKEAFNVGLDLAADDPRVLNGEPFRGVNIWPEVEGFRDTMLAYYDHIWALSRALHRAFELDLNLPQDYFAPHFTAPLATLRVLSYPAATDGAGIGAGAHTDYGSVTLLMTDGVGGLQVKPRGQDWIDAPHVPGAYVVNIGDCLMRWSNDIYVSTPHRVLPPKTARRSIAFFLDPNPDSVITALPGTGEAKYAAITGADYLRSRLDATYTPKDIT
ncbi:MAG: isopenicillin N synthase family oxygenase [Alphaproteobacteria bacterium]|nr:isopenicillin N synthase family oxygenase [Alphaproteobacteria bacterium]MBU1279165.1 isopenicillin N synthase family oxygenase [Alphaproteobacteria bacterium]MBU1572551.1 isopenicillin N synthase family oxygenase [Alphaproteobacteria bacterium]MBU1830709.1 isopenicillin N synthase family oxygenase [Alphaproteobacteria bacterium]MBU2077549.1 isopenicillin N synthase family oxygenase [Alphaproteobacteria bacterium]